MVSIPAGIATTIAVVLHEVPQEIADFGVLLYSGFSKKKALLLNFLSAAVAIVGAIVGWNIYTGSSTNIQVLITIILTWVLCPIIAGLIAMFFFILTKKLFQKSSLHLLRLDAYTRTALLLAGAF